MMYRSRHGKGRVRKENLDQKVREMVQKAKVKGTYGKEYVQERVEGYAS